MKRFIFTLLCMAFFASVFAQKSYIHIYGYHMNSSDYNLLYLTGDIPSGIKQQYNTSSTNPMVIGKLLNQLSELGYEVEFITPTYVSDSNVQMIYLLSKNNSDVVNSVRVVKDNDDSDVYEIARYNLQGMPINKKEKGLQIIVYSNYTTKTIFNE